MAEASSASRPSCAIWFRKMADLLRPITPADSADMLRWRNAPHVRRHVFEQDIIPDDAHRRWFDRMMADDTSAYFVFERDGQPCGMVGLTGIVSATGDAHWGFYTAPHAPKGTGTAMLSRAIDHAFGSMGLRQISAEVLDFNTASLRLHDKLGFVRTALRQGHQLGDGTFHDVVLFAKAKVTDP